MVMHPGAKVAGRAGRDGRESRRDQYPGPAVPDFSAPAIHTGRTPASRIHFSELQTHFQAAISTFVRAPRRREPAIRPNRYQRLPQTDEDQVMHARPHLAHKRHILRMNHCLGFWDYPITHCCLGKLWPTSALVVQVTETMILRDVGAPLFLLRGCKDLRRFGGLGRFMTGCRDGPHVTRSCGELDHDIDGIAIIMDCPQARFILLDVLFILRGLQARPSDSVAARRIIKLEQWHLECAEVIRAPEPSNGTRKRRAHVSFDAVRAFAALHCTLGHQRMKI